MGDCQEVNVPRYEFRVFAPDLSRIAACMRQLGDVTGRRQSMETYLLSWTAGDFGVKIRDHRIEIKERLDTAGFLERWKPKCRQPFPLSSSFLHQELLPALGISVVETGGTRIGEDFLLEALLKPHPEVRQVQVDKRRVFVQFNQCRAEYVGLSVEGTFLQSAAVEAEKREPVLEAIARLGLDPACNTSYPRQLSDVADLKDETRLPR